MQRSLFSGVSGMTNHQLILDNTANNLSNVSTAGFKATRVNFSTALNQTRSSGVGPGNGLGGINPQQVGLGVSTSSLDVEMKQGALLATGRTLDVAIQGEGFFQVRQTEEDSTNALREFYTRVGNFGFDKNDDLVDLGSGLKVVGLDTGSGAITAPTVINIAKYRSIAATATDTINFQGNLNGTAAALRGTALQSVLSLTERSPNGTSFSTASEETPLQRLTLFTGPSANPGDQLSGSTGYAGNATAAAPTTLDSFSMTATGRMRVTFTIPPVDTSSGAGAGTPAGSIVLNIRTADPASGPSLGSITIPNADYSSASADQRTFTIETSGQVSPGDQVYFTANGNGNLGTEVIDWQTDLLTDIHVFGTKPDGTAYAGTANVNLWEDTVNDLVSALNNTLREGSQAFGSVKLDNGNLIANSLGAGDGFSLFLGERNPIPNFSNIAGVAVNNADLSGAPPTFFTTALAKPTSAIATGNNYTVPNAMVWTPQFSIGGAGVASVTSTAPVTVNIKVNGTVKGSYSFTAAGPLSPAPSELVLARNDTVTWELTGTPANVTVTPTVAGLRNGLGYFGNAVQGAEEYTVQSGEAGLFKPTFSLVSTGSPPDLSTQSGKELKLAIKVNGIERGSVTVPAIDYSRADARTSFTIDTFPHISVGDVVSFDATGNLDLGSGTFITWTSQTYNDSDPGNMTKDTIDGNGAANLDGVPDMFQDGGGVDVNAWQYANDTNQSMDWYKMRMVPGVVTSTITVYDQGGTAHTLESRFFKTGSKPDPSATSDGARVNYWDQIVAIDPRDGVLTGDLLPGVTFDAKGRYIGPSNFSTTPAGTALSGVSRGLGDSIDQVEVTWAGAGATRLSMNFGSPLSTTGLTGYGSSSTAAAITQNGYASGALESMSIKSSGELVGLYTNGQSKALSTLQVVTFRNPGGLLSAGGNLWQQSANSGDPQLRVPGEGGAGTLTSGTLEGSNVDIATEFTRLITAQRGFQVNARVIQTTDQILQELAGLIR